MVQKEKYIYMILTVNLHICEDALSNKQDFSGKFSLESVCVYSRGRVRIDTKTCTPQID